MSVQISKRRIQKLGGSSLIVTLPKTWIRKLGLAAGDEVIVIDEGTHLKILPNTSDTERKVKTLMVRYGSHLKSIDLSGIITCAFQRGYDWVYIHPSRSTMPEVAHSLKELRESPYVLDVKEYYDHIEVRIAGSDEATTTLVKRLRSDMLLLLEEAESTRLQAEDLEEWTKRALVKVNEVAHLLYKKGVLACQNAPLDPVTVGVLKSVVKSFGVAVRVASGISNLELRKKIISMLKDITLTLFGGISNNSMKRLGEARESLESLKSMVEENLDETPSLYGLLGFIESSDLLIRQASCAFLGSEKTGQALQ